MNTNIGVRSGTRSTDGERYLTKAQNDVVHGHIGVALRSQSDPSSCLKLIFVGHGTDPFDPSKMLLASNLPLVGARSRRDSDRGVQQGQAMEIASMAVTLNTWLDAEPESNPTDCKHAPPPTGPSERTPTA